MIQPRSKWLQVLLQYLIAISIVAVISVLEVVLYDFLAGAHVVLFMAAVALASWFGGLGPGLLATVLSAIALHYFVFVPNSPPGSLSDTLLPLAIFAAVAALINWFQESLRRAREAAAAASSDLNSIVRGSGDGITVQNPAGEIIFANPAAAHMLGYPSPEALIVAPMQEIMAKFEILDEDGQPLPLSLLPSRQALAGNTPDPMQVRFRIKATGEEHWSIVRSVPIQNTDGSLRFVVNNFQDITPIKLAEGELRRQHEQLHVTLTSIGDAVIATDDKGRITFINHVAEILIGYSTTEALGQPLEEVFHIFNEVTNKPAESPVVTVLRENRIVGLANSTILHSRDGHSIPIDDSAAPIQDEKGNVSGVVLVFRDRSDRHRREAQQRFFAQVSDVLGSSLDYDTTFQHIAELAVPTLADWCAIDLVDENGRLYEVALMGPTLEQQRIVHNLRMQAQDSDPQRSAGVPVVQSGKPLLTLDIAELYKQGGWDDLAVQTFNAMNLKSGLVVPLKLHDKVIGAINLSTSGERALTEADIPVAQELASRATVAIENAQLYREAQSQREHLRITLQSIHDGVIATDARGRVEFMNPIAEEITRWPAAEAVGKPLDDVLRVIREETREPVSDLVLRTMREGIIPDPEEDKIVIDRNGDECPIAITSSTIVDESDKPIGVILILRDIRERKQRGVRQRFLVEASTQLASSLDVETTLRNIANLAVPQIADWCSIELLNTEGKLERLALVHPDPDSQHLVDVLQARYDAIPNRPNRALEVVKSGEPFVLSEIPDEMLVEAALDDETLDMLRKLQLRSSMIVPIKLRDKSIGVISFSMGASGRDLDSEALAMAEALAQRAASAIENANLYRQAELEREHLHVTLASIGDAVIATDAEGHISFLNQVAQQLTGWSEDEAIGKHLDDVFCIVNEETRATVESPVEKVLREGQIVGLANHTVLIAKDETEIPIDDSGAPIRDAEGNLIGVILVFRDIRERKAADLQREIYADQQKIIADLGQRALAGLDLDTLMDEAVRLTHDTLGVDLVKVLEVLPDEEDLLLRAGVGWNSGLAGKRRVGGGTGSHAGYTLLSDRPVIMEDLRTETRFSEPLLSEHNVISGMSVLIEGRGGKPWGVLGAHTREKRTFSQDDIHFLQTIANILAEAIRRTQAEQQRETFAYQQQVIADLGQHALAGADLDTLMDEAVHLMRDTLGVDLVKVLEALPSEEDLLLRAGVGWKKGLVGKRRVGGGTGSHAGYTLLSAHPVIMEDLRTETRFTEPLLNEHKVISGMSVLIEGRGGKPWGVLGAHTRDKRTFSQDDIHFLQAVANIIAEAIQRQQTRVDLERSLDRTRDLYEVSRRIGLLNTPQAILEAIVSSRVLNGLHRATISQFSTTWDENVPALATYSAIWQKDGSKPRIVGSSYNLAEYDLPKLVQRSEPTVIGNVEEDSRVSPSSRDAALAQGVRSYILFPLIASGQWFGLLSVQWDKLYVATETDARHMQGLVDQAAAAIYNLRLLESESKARRAAEQADALKMKFLAMISHELRTPLTSIKGFTTTLLAEDIEWDSTNQREFISIINEEADNLTDLIEQLLDLSRLNAGTLTIQKRLVPMGEIFNQAMPHLYILAQEHNLELSMDDDLPSINADARRISQVITNIVSNATKYSDPGTSIKIKAARDSEMIRVDVTDQGAGIPEADMDVVFEAFRQAENRPTDETKGAGLGLAISRGLIESHGGNIWIADTGPHGTTVSFTLPVADEETVPEG